MLIVAALYLLLNVAYERVLGLPGVAARAAGGGGAGPGHASARRASAVVSFAIFLSAAGFVNATILQMPRSYYAMAEDGALPRAFLRVDPRTQVQPVGLAFFALTMLRPGAARCGSFEKLLNYVMFSDALAIAIVASTLFVLRRRDPAGPGFRMPGYPCCRPSSSACLLAVAAARDVERALDRGHRRRHPAGRRAALPAGARRATGR